MTIARSKIAAFSLIALAALCLCPALGQRKYLRFEQLNEEDGLSSYFVTDILQDHKGFLWIATTNGLNRFDGYSFRKWHWEQANEGSLIDSHVNVLAEDGLQRIWAGTVAGLVRYDEDDERFTPVSLGPVQGQVFSLLRDSDDRLWVGTQRGLAMIDPRSGRLLESWTADGRPNQLRSSNVLCLQEDSRGHLWVGTTRGLYRYRPETRDFDYIEVNPINTGRSEQGLVTAICDDRAGGLWIGTGNGLRHLRLGDGGLTSFVADEATDHGFSGRGVMDVLLDQSGRLWVATDYNGLYLREGEGQPFSNYVYSQGDRYSLAANQLTHFHEDRDGSVWVGTMSSGLCVFLPRSLDLGQYRNDPTNPYSLPMKDLWAFASAGEHDLWIGSDQGLIRWELASGRFRLWRPKPDAPTEILANRVRTILPLANHLLLGGHEGIMRFDLASERYQDAPANPSLPAPRQVRAMLRDRAGVIWAGSYVDGLYQLDDRGQVLRHFGSGAGEQALASARVRSLYADNRDTLWVGTKDGLLSLDATRSRIQSFFAAKGKTGRDRHELMCIHAGPGEALWLGSHDQGLVFFDQEQGEVRYLTVADGLPSNLIYGIVGKDPLLWLATDHGLVRYNSESGEMRIFDTSDGAQSFDHNSGAYFEAADGALLVAGPNGLNRFFPEKLMLPCPLPRTMLTGFRLNGVELRLAPTPKGPLPIHKVSQLLLDHRQNVFALDFALQSAYGARKHYFAYKLEGFDDDWIQLEQGRHSATYTNLPPRDYVFRVKGNDGKGVWDPQGISLAIRKVAAPWQSWPAYLLYASASIGLILWYLRHQRRKLRRERDVVDRLRQVDKLRDDFLANTSHELRTPLNGIIGLAEALRDGPEPVPGATRESLELIISISQRLSALVNDILDFSQLRTRNLVLVKQEVDLHALVEVVLTLTQASLGGKSLRLINGIARDCAHVHADEGRLLQILHNLIANAVKFTHRGEVEVKSETQDQEVIVHVRDTGIGIPPGKQDLIFQSFRQADEDIAREYGGTGLGLAITRELVQLHGGRMWLSSEVGKGSIFSFSLPRTLGESAPTTGEPAPSPAARLEPSPHLGESAAVAAGVERAAFRILVVDDEPINCTILESHLLRHHVTTAHDGERCLELLAQEAFDLVLLDIMMPRLSGYEVCRRIRAQHSAAELPVIFLSARNLANDLNQGFDCGANDYITKPITKGELLRRVNVQLELLASHRHLEARIAARTAELEQKNAEIIRTQKQLITQEKMANIGALASGVAHEIRNPLNFVHGLALASVELFDELEQLLGQGASAPGGDEQCREIVGDLRRNLEVILKHGRRANAIVETMMTLSRGGGGARTRQRLSPLLENQAQLVYRDMRRKGLCPVVEFAIAWADGEPELECNTREMSRVFANLVRNAIEAMDERQSQPPRLGLSSTIADGTVTYAVADNGCGMTPEQQARAFEPFVTSKSPDEHHIGLGLTLCYEIVTQDLGGELMLESHRGSGTRVLVRLPLPRGAEVA